MSTVEKLICNLKDEVSKWFYQKTEVDSKLNSKAEANHTHSISGVSDLQSSLDGKADEGHTHTLDDVTDLSVASSQGNGLMSSADKIKLDGVEEGANKIVVDSAMSESSVNPVQNKIVKAELDSLNSTKANTGHTHNDYDATVTVPCEYGTVKKFKKNGWAFVVWEGIDISSIPKDTWITLADIGWSNQAGNRYTGNFQTQDINSNRFRINENGQLGAWRVRETSNQGHYGYIVYPTAD